MDWHGHSFAYYRLTRVSVTNLLDMLAEIDVHVSFCVLGITAELYPNLIQNIAEAGHEVYGHGMYHEPAFEGRPFREQRHEMIRMRDSIEAACGVKVRGIGCPHHGLADENTLRAASEVGIEFVESRIRGEGSAVPVSRKVEGTDATVLVPGGGGRGASDYTDRRPDWAFKHEEVFSPTGARKKWMSDIDWAKENNTMTGLVIHPWMLMINAGEVQVVKDLLRHAKAEGAWFATVAGLIDLANESSVSIVSSRTRVEPEAVATGERSLRVLKLPSQSGEAALLLSVHRPPSTVHPPTELPYGPPKSQVHPHPSRTPLLRQERLPHR